MEYSLPCSGPVSRTCLQTTLSQLITDLGRADGHPPAFPQMLSWMLGWMLDTASALATLHHTEPGALVHRDLKLANLLVVPAGEGGTRQWMATTDKLRKCSWLPPPPSPPSFIHRQSHSRRDVMSL